MVSKRRKIYFLLFLIFSILACSPADIVPIPAPTKSPTQKPPTHDVVIPDNCYKDGYQTFVAMGQNYCFAHPVGYYATEASKAENTELRYFNNTPLTNPTTIEELEAQVTAPLKVILLITSQPVADIESLEKLAIEGRPEGDKTEPFPWTLGSENALIRKEVKEDGGIETVAYFVYARHEKKYYTLQFQSLYSLSDRHSSATKLEELFFAVLETFTFIG